ncbi:unnamed protein product [Leptidea sinapis]|uniref:Uncharacterized protein n=1 Tax=Leptidea sinapis TaxID=189913 RepID=A0A5E4R5I0_9NEOP|nr:unnamed protein product [Leptidea sinapis]
MVRELAGYEGFLSSCRFLDDSHILTGSGDMKMSWASTALACGRWLQAPDEADGDTRRPCSRVGAGWMYNHGYSVQELSGHENRVTSVSVAPSGIALTSCSWDQSVKVWG